MNYSEIGHALEERRKSSNVTKADILRSVKISKPSLNALLKGEGNPSIDKVLAVAKHLGLTLFVGFPQKK